jgi:hypothetical protein
MIVASALGGCTPEQDVAQCEVEAIRLYPNDPPNKQGPITGNAASRYVMTCMKAKGYEFVGCLIFSDRTLRDPDCCTTRPGSYKSTGWRQLLSITPEECAYFKKSTK